MFNLPFSSKFYKVDILASSDASFGCKVLSGYLLELKTVAQFCFLFLDLVAFVFCVTHPSVGLNLDVLKVNVLFCPSMDVKETSVLYLP